MAHCLYEKARLYDLCEAGLNFLKCHGSIYAEVFITRNRADRQVMLRGKRTYAKKHDWWDVVAGAALGA